MKKQITLLMCLLCLLVAGCNEGNMAFWGLTADDADALTTGRLVFTLVDEPLVEAGGTIKYYTSDPEWGPQPDVAGLCLILHGLEIETQSGDLPAFLDGLSARAYGGLEVIWPTRKEKLLAPDRLDEKPRRARPNWILGTALSTDENYRWAIVTEYTWGDGGATAENESVVSLGLRLGF